MFAIKVKQLDRAPRNGRALGLALLLGALVLALLVQVLAGSFFAGLYALVSTVRAGHPIHQMPDAAVTLMLVFSQVLSLLIFLPWWRLLRGRDGAHPLMRPVGSSRRGMVVTVCSLLVLGLAFQVVVSLILSLVLPLFPHVMHEYDQIMQTATGSSAVWLELLSVCVLAPLSEEIICRGVMLEGALRLAAPSHVYSTAGGGASRPVSISSRSFWVANLFQALAFGVLHFNITQGLYAFALGLVLGWVYWKTGRLRYAMVLHAAMNASSYVMSLVLGYAPEPFSSLLVIALLLGAAYALVALHRGWKPIETVGSPDSVPSAEPALSAPSAPSVEPAPPHSAPVMRASLREGLPSDSGSSHGSGQA